MTANSVLKSLRALNNLTQGDMATTLNISVQTYNRKELGQREFTLQESKIIADMFNKSIEEIFFNEKSNTKGTLISTA